MILQTMVVIVAVLAMLHRRLLLPASSAFVLEIRQEGVATAARSH